MPSYRVRPEAELDLAEIGLRIARLSPGAADRFIDGIVSRFVLLAENPFMGAADPNLGRTIAASRQANT